MECRKCSENLTAFLDGELSSAESGQIQSHLRLCPSCSKELQSLREAEEFCASHHREIMPNPGSWNLVRARLSETSAIPVSRASIFSRFRWAMAILAVVAIFAFAYTEYQQIQERNFERYVSQYMQQRKSQIVRQSTSQNPYGNNPFLEVEETVIENPFRSEDR
jgi:anti-sigma factor RsiW